MAKKQKYYVVWDGAEDGVFTTWEACQQSVSGYPSAKYKSFKSEEEAEEAFAMGYEAYSAREAEIQAKNEQSKNEQSKNKQSKNKQSKNKQSKNKQGKNEQANNEQGRPEYNASSLPAGAINQAIAVDAACSGNPGKMEYRGVYLLTGKEIFHYGPVHGTNNIGEFLAIVHGLALLKQKGLHTMPIYSDSVNAQLWVRKKTCKTTLARNEKTEQLFQMIERAEAWLKNNTYANPIIKWPTEEWGEIPADFGRK